MIKQKKLLLKQLLKQYKFSRNNIKQGDYISVDINKIIASGLYDDESISDLKKIIAKTKNRLYVSSVNKIQDSVYITGLNDYVIQIDFKHITGVFNKKK